jgi:hypothetical protein
LTETSLVLTLLWWSLLVFSLVLILKEMRKWLKSRTVSAEVWSDSPRIEPPGDEVLGVAKWLKSLSRNRSGFLKIKLAVSNAIIDRVSLTLGLDREEVSKSLREDEFAKRVFGRYTSIADFLSAERVGQLEFAKNEKRRTWNTDAQNEQFDEIKIMFDKMKRWEKEYESQGSF